MSHSHCDQCYQMKCSNNSSCPMIDCSHGCSARMHQCKRDDHDHVCPNVYVPCTNAMYGCPLTMQRSQISHHLSECSASVVVCSFVHMPKYELNDLNKSENSNDSDETNLVPAFAQRDALWSNHLVEFEREQTKRKNRIENEKKKSQMVEKVIRSEKYPYITIPECVLSRGDGVVCISCRLHLRNLEEHEEQRLAEASEEERMLMANFTLNSPWNSVPSPSPSLVQMSYTSIKSNELPMTTASAGSTSMAEAETQSEVFPAIESELTFPSSYIYRLNYFAGNSSTPPKDSVTHHIQFPCLACCRRNEIEQHIRMHNYIDCSLKSFLIEQCPKAQYGCANRWQRLEPARKTGEPIRIRFDAINDAIAFQWTPFSEASAEQQIFLMDLPTEVLREILLHLDSLSLRNTSRVCRRLRDLCQDLLSVRGIVLNEYERHYLSHGDVTWIERRKHWLFSNTSAAVPQWRLTDRSKATAWNDHIHHCPYGETKDLEKEKPFPLPAWVNPKTE